LDEIGGTCPTTLQGELLRVWKQDGFVNASGGATTKKWSAGECGHHRGPMAIARAIYGRTFIFRLGRYTVNEDAARCRQRIEDVPMLRRIS